MTISVKEYRFDRERSSDDATLRYIVSNTSDDQEAIVALRGIAPLAWNGLQRGNPRLAQVGPTLWIAEVPYALGQFSPGLDTGDVSFSFQFGTESQRIRYALETIASVAAAGTPKDFENAINVSPEEDDIEGMEIAAPIARFTYDFRVPHGQLTEAYKVALLNLISETPVNATTWRGFPAGTVKIEGINGRESTDGDTTLSFSFAYKPNRTGVKVGGLPEVDVDGWDVLWVWYAKADDPTASAIRIKPTSGYVVRVYKRGDFSVLGF